VWNEFAIKNCLDAECCVVAGDSNNDAGDRSDFASAEWAMSRPNLSAFYSFRHDCLPPLSPSPSAEGAAAVAPPLPFTFTCTSVITATIDSAFARSPADGSRTEIMSFDLCGAQPLPLPRYQRVAIGGTFDRMHNGNALHEYGAKYNLIWSLL
jgi:hypothetical protein